MMEANQSDDLGAANAKLAGDWPGWEWMKEAVKRHQDQNRFHDAWIHLMRVPYPLAIQNPVQAFREGYDAINWD